MEVRRLTRILLAGAALLPLSVGAVDVELISRTDIESPIDSNGPSRRIAGITPDGRYTLFPSYASNLLAGDTNRSVDLFLHDGASGTLERVSLGSGDIQADADAGGRAGISDDGRFVVFDSLGSNLVGTPAAGHRQVYLRDRAAGTTTLLSQLSGGAAGTADSANPQISADGRYVAFESHVAFDAKDTNGQRDIYRLDRTTGAIVLMSISEDGRIGNDASFEPQISADGSSVAFVTWATNLVPGDTNNYWDLLLRKPAAGTTQRISRKVDGTQLDGYSELAAIGALSADGRYVLMNTYVAADPADTNNFEDGYLYDSQSDSVQRVTHDANGAQIEGGPTRSNRLSRDASRIAMESSAANVVPGLTTNGYRVFVRELGSGAVTHVTFRDGGEVQGDDAFGAGMSDDGSAVVAVSYTSAVTPGDTNGMLDVIRQAGATSPAQRLSAPIPGASAAAGNHDSGFAYMGQAASTDGRYVAFGSRASNLVTGDNNGATDVFVRDRLLGTTERVSVHSDGSEGWCSSFQPSISDDGRYVAFQSCTPFELEVPGLRMDIYIHDRILHTTRIASVTPDGVPADWYSTDASLSADGRYLAFNSCATDLVAGDSNALCDIFVRDLSLGATALVTRSVDSAGANQPSYSPRMSRDGRYIAFTSLASNLVADDTNGEEDTFVFDRDTQTVERVSVGSAEEEANGFSSVQGISADGSQVLFYSTATNLVTGSPFGAAFVRDRTAGTTEIVSRTSGGNYFFGGIPSAISPDGRRAALITNDSSIAPDGAALVLYDRDTQRLDLVRPLDEQFGINTSLAFTGNGAELLLSSPDNTLVADDGNNHFVDVFVFGRIEDTLFVDGFEVQQ